MMTEAVRLGGRNSSEILHQKRPLWDQRCRIGDAAALEIVLYDSSGTRVPNDFGTETAQGKTFARIGPLGSGEVAVVVRQVYGTGLPSQVFPL